MLDAASSVPVTAHRPARRGGWRSQLGYRIYRSATRLGWAEPEINGLDALIRPGDVVLDVGASLGMYSVPLGHLTGPSGRVDSFEPQLRGFLTVNLLRLLAGSNRGRVRRTALGAAVGEGTIAVPYIRGFPIFGHGHIGEGVDEGGRRTARTRTRISTVDAWCAAERLGRIAYIKIDVEGYEPAVVAGAVGVIDRDRPTLQIEIEDRHLVRYGRDAAGFLAEITNRWPEYRMYTWSENGWTPADRIVPQIRNYLFATGSVSDS